MKKELAHHVALEATGDLEGVIGKVVSRHRSADAASRAAHRYQQRCAREGHPIAVTTGVSRRLLPLRSEVMARDLVPLAPPSVVPADTPPQSRGRVFTDALASVQKALDEARERRRKGS